jgi:hypothetical protein
MIAARSSLGVSRARGVAGSTRRVRCDRALLRRRDVELLGWLGEQYSARLDQLALLEGCGMRTTQRTVARLGDAGLVTRRRILVGEPAWVLPTGVGLRVCGSPFSPWQPRLGLLAHVAAVNDVRLHVQGRSPGSEWVSERVLARERSAGEHLPDGVLLLDGRRVAIEVELTVKSRRRVAAILHDLTGRFDAVVYFCSPPTHRLLSEFQASGRWTTLAVRELPGREHPLR